LSGGEGSREKGSERESRGGEGPAAASHAKGSVEREGDRVHRLLQFMPLSLIKGRMPQDIGEPRLS
jgi:hypothetical protein